jgi:soluble lytic murein transglycosylase
MPTLLLAEKIIYIFIIMKTQPKIKKKSQKKPNISLPFPLVLITLGIVGATWFTPKIINSLTDLFSFSDPSSPQYQLDAPSQVLPLATATLEERKTPLETIASSKEKSLDRARAKYLLAMDALQQYEGGEALNYLTNLEKEYPILAPYILLRRGRAYELTNDMEKAQKTWLELMEKYPDSLVVAEALYKLGSFDTQYWEQAISKYPQHPRTQELAYEILKKDLSRQDLLLLLAQYDSSYRGNEAREVLITKYKDKLTPEQWQIIADGYWENGLYDKAALSYQKAPVSRQNLYRKARSFQVIDKKKEAITGYKELISKFPSGEETGLGYQRLASLSSGDEALNYLNQALSKFPEEAPEILAQKFSILTNLKRTQEAQQVTQLLIDKYPNSEPAASYRWQIAKNFANNQDYISAWQWAKEIIVNNPDSDLAPKAGFWIGKWATKLEQVPQAKESFEYVIANYPQSYYAWRSAGQLGWNVGNFSSVRQLTPTVNKPETRPLLPAGSVMFQELYLLGEDEDAITLFNAEIGKKDELTVSEQFTEGILQQLQGNNLKGINLIWSLKKKDDPQALKEWQILRKSPEYWYGLFPFPYENIILNWSKERQLNPLLVTSLIRQESRFEPQIKSPVGATGLMQVMPDTGKEIAQRINLKDYSLTDPEDNVKLGTWYLDYTHKVYDNNSLLAIASYNAGPGNVSSWVEKYKLDDFDIFVENIPFAETKGYVETVFGNYWNYLRLYNPEISQKVGIK